MSPPGSSKFRSESSCRHLATIVLSGGGVGGGGSLGIAGLFASWRGRMCGYSVHVGVGGVR